MIQSFLLILAAAVLVALFVVTRVGALQIARRYPPVGQFVTVRGTRLHFVHVPRPEGASLPPVLFIHGASSNLRDQLVPFLPVFQGRAELLFVDRPGLGWSERGPDRANHTPTEQAQTIGALMDHLKIERAVVVGHSFGGAVAAAFGVAEPAKTAGLVFLAAASHPWPGAATSWYNKVTSVPVLGFLFSELFALPGGLARLPQAVACVFAPNALPGGYSDDAGIPLILRPASFRANARDVEGLYRHVSALAPRYRTIAAPTVVITGNRDTVVYEEIHSEGLARDIPGAELVWVDNLGHKPDWVAPDLVLAAVAKVAGHSVDLQAAKRAVESRIAGDRYNVGRCPEPSGATQSEPLTQ